MALTLSYDDCQKLLLEVDRMKESIQLKLRRLQDEQHQMLQGGHWQGVSARTYDANMGDQNQEFNNLCDTLDMIVTQARVNTDETYERDSD